MAASVKTSFQKKSRGKVLQIPGTKPSLHNNQLLVSTGIPSLDSLLGGGIAVGTVLLIGEDTFGSYSKIMLKYFIAEGATNKHNLLLSSADLDMNLLLKELPSPIIDDPGEVSVGKDQESTDSMKIAWRYQNLPKVQSKPSVGQFGHYFDLTKTLDNNVLENCVCDIINLQSDPQNNVSTKRNSMLPAYEILLQKINEHIKMYQLGTTSQSDHKNVLRIGIHSLGSPQWSEEGDGNSGICKFLYSLRMLMRTSFATCVLTMPSHLFYDMTFIENVQHMCDTVLNLESFVNTENENNPALKDYHGLLHVMKLPRLNSLTAHSIETLDLAFKLRRKKFVIEKLHLPPDLSETASRDQEESYIVAAKSGCASSSNNSKLDF